MADGRENHPSPLPAAGATGAGGGGGTPCHPPLIIITVATEPGGEGTMAVQGRRRNVLLNLLENMKSTPLPPRTRAALSAPTGVPCLPPSDGPPIPGSCRGKQGKRFGQPSAQASCLQTRLPPQPVPGGPGRWGVVRDRGRPWHRPIWRCPGRASRARQPPARRTPPVVATPSRAPRARPSQLSCQRDERNMAPTRPEPPPGIPGGEGVPQKIKREHTGEEEKEVGAAPGRPLMQLPEPG